MLRVSIVLWSRFVLRNAASARQNTLFVFSNFQKVHQPFNSPLPLFPGCPFQFEGAGMLFIENTVAASFEHGLLLIFI